MPDKSPCWSHLLHREHGTSAGKEKELWGLLGQLTAVTTSTAFRGHGAYDPSLHREGAGDEEIKSDQCFSS